jgi:hypothetical protein
MSLLNLQADHDALSSVKESTLKKTVVEGILPEGFLARHAVYMQTCAHIELVSWYVVQVAEGFDPTVPEQVIKFLRLKQRNYDLADALEKSSEFCSSDLAARICSVATRIKDGLDNRNLAAHGAFFMDQQSGGLMVEHYWKDFSTKNWLHIEEPITVEDVEFAISNADDILRELITIRAEIVVSR